MLVLRPLVVLSLRLELLRRLILLHSLFLLLLWLRVLSLLLLRLAVYLRKDWFGEVLFQLCSPVGVKMYPLLLKKCQLIVLPNVMVVENRRGDKFRDRKPRAR